MNMNASSKKPIPLSAYGRSRLVTEQSTGAQAAKKVLDATKHILISNPETTNISDNVSDEAKMLVLRAEGYRGSHKAVILNLHEILWS